MISERSVNLSIHSASSHKHRDVELRLDQKLKDMKLQAADFGLPFSQSEGSMRHFSEERGAPAFE